MQVTLKQVPRALIGCSYDTSEMIYSALLPHDPTTHWFMYAWPRHPRPI